ncbi:hypothetical protein PGT21_030222 [Puccinia graminis f. sp. tritici]|uniref:Uncharacterized protein n=1 Tax=Puccinia graminis f. sp. tritici TaxID=56615 RepID=A0A5B0PL60_PUCGR|nr:hypothetical protein PGT21_030222 [Puccinia graminis f. sp. tritici]
MAPTFDFDQLPVHFGSLIFLAQGNKCTPLTLNRFLGSSNGPLCTTDDFLGVSHYSEMIRHQCLPGFAKSSRGDSLTGLSTINSAISTSVGVSLLRDGRFNIDSRRYSKTRSHKAVLVSRDSLSSCSAPTRIKKNTRNCLSSSQAAELTFKTRSTNAISNLARASAIAAGSGCASGSGIPAAVHSLFNTRHLSLEFDSDEVCSSGIGSVSICSTFAEVLAAPSSAPAAALVPAAVASPSVSERFCLPFSDSFR